MKMVVKTIMVGGRKCMGTVTTCVNKAQLLRRDRQPGLIRESEESDKAKVEAEKLCSFPWANWHRPFFKLHNISTSTAITKEACVNVA